MKFLTLVSQWNHQEKLLNYQCLDRSTLKDSDLIVVVAQMFFKSSQCPKSHQAETKIEGCVYSFLFVKYNIPTKKVPNT